MSAATPQIPVHFWSPLTLQGCFFYFLLLQMSSGTMKCGSVWGDFPPVVQKGKLRPSWWERFLMIPDLWERWIRVWINPSSSQQEIHSRAPTAWPSNLPIPSGWLTGDWRLVYACIFHSGLNSCPLRLDTRLPFLGYFQQWPFKRTLSGIVTASSPIPQARATSCSLRAAEWFQCLGTSPAHH